MPLSACNRGVYWRRCGQVGGLLAVVPLIVGAADGNDLSVLSPASPPTHFITKFFIFELSLLTGIILIPYGTLLIYFLIRYRQRPDDDGSDPEQIYGSRPLELAWTVLPLLIVFLIFLIVLRSVADIRANHAPPQDGDLVVQVVGHQWWWEYRYPGQNVVTANELHVPVHQKVFLEMRSADVIHDFWAPRLAAKADIIPGRATHTWFEAEEAGEYGGQCAEFCGAQHANMMIRVAVDPPDEFQRWLANQQQPAAAPESTAAQEGRHTFLSLACVNCHTIRGTPAAGTVGPDLTHLMSRHTLATGMVPNDPDHLRQWVQNPQQIKNGCRMPALGLSRQEVERVVAYLITLH